MPVGRPAFEFPALTYFSERAEERVAYVTLFPVENRMRANLFVYREVDDPWLREMRHRPVETMNAALPRLRRITGEYGVAGDVKIRPADLYVSAGYRQPGVVLVGDAFAATCPVTGTGTGTDKVFTSPSSATSISPPGLRPRAWTLTRSLPFTTIRSSRLAIPGRWQKPSASARSRSRTGYTGVRSAGRASWRGSAKAPCDRCETGISVGPNRRAHSSSSSSSLSSSA